MSNSEVKLTVASASSSAELVVVDATRHEVARGVGTLETTVGPGFYKVRQRVGERESSDLIEVGAEAAKIVLLPLLRFSSPIPLSGTSTSREFQRDELGRVRKPKSLGEGAAVTIMIRDREWRGKRHAHRHRLQEEVSRLNVQTMTESVNRPLLKLGAIDTNTGCFIAELSLAPGSHVLTQRLDGNTGEQACVSFIAHARWKAHLFLQLANAGAGETSLPLDLDRAAIVYATPDTLLSGQDPQLLLHEAVRKAFRRGASAMARKLLAHDDGRFPMTSLYLAHLELDGLATMPETLDAFQGQQRMATFHAGRWNRARLGQLIDRLARRLGESFPDVLALRIKQWRVGSSRPFDPGAVVLTGPPMLAASWTELTRPILFDGTSLVDSCPQLQYHFTPASSTTWFKWLEQPGSRKTSAANLLPTYFRNLELNPSGDPEVPDRVKLAGALENLLSGSDLGRWLEILKADDLAHNTPPDLSVLDRGILVVCAKLQAEGLTDRESVQSTINGLTVPASMALDSARRLLERAPSTATAFIAPTYSTFRVRAPFGPPRLTDPSPPEDLRSPQSTGSHPVAVFLRAFQAARDLLMRAQIEFERQADDGGSTPDARYYAIELAQDIGALDAIFSQYLVGIVSGTTPPSDSMAKQVVALHEALSETEPNEYTLLVTQFVVEQERPAPHAEPPEEKSW